MGGDKYCKLSKNDQKISIFLKIVDGRYGAGRCGLDEKIRREGKCKAGESLQQQALPVLFDRRTASSMCVGIFRKYGLERGIFTGRTLRLGKKETRFSEIGGRRGHTQEFERLAG